MAKAAGDAATGERAKGRAEALVETLAEDGAHRERLLHPLSDPRPWSRWHFQRYAGL